MKTESKRKNILVLVAIALFFVACPGEGSSNGNSKSGGKKTETNVSVEVASGTAFQGLDEVRDPETGAVKEDSLTYISMENDREIVLRVTMAQSTEIYQRLLFRTNAPSIFRLGTQSPANADVVELRPGQTTEVHIRSLYNNAEDPRMQTDTMHVVGLNAENEETILREFRVGSYKRLGINIRFVKAKLYEQQEISIFNGNDLSQFKDSANKVLNAAIVNVGELSMEEKVAQFDLNDNGQMEEYYYEAWGGAERIALRTFFLDMLREGADDNQIVLAYVANMEGVVRVVGKVAENAVAIPFGASVSMDGTPYYFAHGRDINNENARETLTPVSIKNDEANNYTVVTFREKILASDVTEYVLSLGGRYVTLGGALYYQNQDSSNSVYAAPITLNASKLAGRERFFVPVHEIGHMFGLGDAVAGSLGNLMTCATNFWDPQKTPFLQGRKVPISRTGESDCPYDAQRGFASQWDTWIREPQWVM